MYKNPLQQTISKKESNQKTINRSIEVTEGNQLEASMRDSMKNSMMNLSFLSESKVFQKQLLQGNQFTAILKQQIEKQISLNIQETVQQNIEKKIEQKSIELMNKFKIDFYQWFLENYDQFSQNVQDQQQRQNFQTSTVELQEIKSDLSLIKSNQTEIVNYLKNFEQWIKLLEENQGDQISILKEEKISTIQDEVVQIKKDQKQLQATIEMLQEKIDKGKQLLIKEKFQEEISAIDIVQNPQNSITIDLPFQFQQLNQKTDLITKENNLFKKNQPKKATIEEELQSIIEDPYVPPQEHTNDHDEESAFYQTQHYDDFHMQN